MRKKLSVTFLIALAVVGVVACGTKKENKVESTSESATTAAESKSSDSSKNVSESSGVQIPDPWKEFTNLDEAVKEVGYDFKVPSSIEGYKTVVYRVISKEAIEAVYFSGDSKTENEDVLSIRKGSDESDSSGDYNEYAEQEKTTFNNVEYTVRGNADKFTSAIWIKDGHFYSLISSKDMSKDSIKKLVEEIIGLN